MRKVKFAPAEYYHVYNRGNNKQIVFNDIRDWIRFLFILLYFQSPLPIHNIGKTVSHYIKHRVFNITGETTEKITANRYVELVSFSLMPNHFHILLREIKNNGISQYMQRIQNSYTKYFNTKYKKVGHVFQGPFQAVHIENNRQILHLSAYIHRNSREIVGWKNKEHLFPWSSYQDFVIGNRWGNLLENQIIISQFNSLNMYRNFVENSKTKDIKRELVLEE